MRKLHNAGIYTRLSINDADNTQKKGKAVLEDESGSIENQKLLLTQFAMLNGWVVSKIYVDDGYGGGDFQRPGFQEMLADTKKGVIDLILVKDLSRLGRDYINVGRYTDVVFPAMGCRFISLLDEIDTSQEDNDMMHFRSLMNDYQLKDLSNKIKAVVSAKSQKGAFMTGRPPYGYIRSEGNKHQLLPEPFAASIIQRIFTLRTEGAGYAKIAGILNGEGIFAPWDYWNARMGKPIELLMAFAKMPLPPFMFAIFLQSYINFFRDFRFLPLSRAIHKRSIEFICTAYTVFTNGIRIIIG